MAVPYRNDSGGGFFKSVATAMLGSRKAVIREYALLLRFPAGSEQFRRRFERLLTAVDVMHDVLGRQVRDALGDKKGLVLGIYDDSSIKKIGKCFEKQSKHCDSEGHFFSGYKVACAAIYRAGKFGVLDATIEYTTKMDACMQAFKALCAQDLAPDIFLFDAWYAAKELFDVITTLGKIYITRLRSNRVAQFGKKGNASLRALAAAIPHKEYEHLRIDKQSYWVIDITLELNDLGKQRVIISKDAVHAEPIFLTTNSKSFSTRFVIMLYKKRFIIEVFFKDAKQFLHLETFQCRTLEKWRIHLAIIQVLHWCIQEKSSISKTIMPIRHFVDKIQSYINENHRLNKFIDEVSKRCQM